MPDKIDLPSERLKALSIAASVFSQISKTETIDTRDFSGLQSPLPRTLSDFRESVDAVFRAAGLEKVEWE